MADWRILPLFIFLRDVVDDCVLLFDDACRADGKCGIKNSIFILESFDFFDLSTVSVFLSVFAGVNFVTRSGKFNSKKRKKKTK